MSCFGKFCIEPTDFCGPIRISHLSWFVLPTAFLKLFSMEFEIFLKMYVYFLSTEFYSLVTCFGKHFILYIISWSFAMHSKALKTSFYSKETFYLFSAMLPEVFDDGTFSWEYLYNLQNGM